MKEKSVRTEEIFVNKNDGKYIEVEGIVLEATRGNITVEIGPGQTVLAKLSGKMRMNKIQILPEDKVRLRLSPYDLTKGIIVRRIKA